MPEQNTYIYDSIETARAVAMTARYLDIGFTSTVIGSAVIMSASVYDELMSKTTAPEPALVAKEV